MQALHHALAAQERAQKEMQHAGHETPLSQEEATLKYEQDLWQRVCTSLTEVHTLLEDIEESERQRAESAALQARAAAGKEATHGTTETDPSGQRTHARSPPHDGCAGESHGGRTARGESPYPPWRASSAGTV